MNKFNLFTGMMLISMVSTAQVNYYVSPTGNNANDGSMANPWATLQFSLEQLSSGDTLNAFGGTYIEKIAIPFSGITFRNVAGETPIVDAGIMIPQDAAIEIYNVSDITIDGIMVQNNVRNDAQGILVEGNCQNITIQNCIVHDIHFSANPDDNATPSKNAQAIIVYGSHPELPITNLKILNNEVYDCRLGYSEGIAVNGNVDGFEVGNNYVHNLTNIGIDIIGHENTCATDSLDQARNGRVYNNIVHDCISEYATSGGLYTDGGRNIIFENNTSYRNGYGIEIGCENPDKTTDSIIVRNNLFYDNEACAMAMGGYAYPSSGKVTNSVIRNNSCLKNDYAGVGFGELYLSYSEDCIIENNIFYTNNILAYAELTQPGLQFNYNLIYSEAGTGGIEVDWNGAYYPGYDAFTAGTSLNTNGLFANPEYVNTDALTADLHISATSAAVNAGNPATLADAAETDMDGEVRIQESMIDCGADETVAIPQSLWNATYQMQVFPNPVNDFLWIHTEMPDATYSIVNAQGVIMQKTTTGDLYICVSDWPAGVYLLVANDGKGSTSFVVL
jgi:hypothetical protein